MIENNQQEFGQRLSLLLTPVTASPDLPLATVRQQ